MELRVSAILAICLFLSALSATGIDAVQCEITNEDAPTMGTLMASPIAPQTEAIILWPNCSYVTEKVNTNGELWFRLIDFDRVASVPQSARILGLTMKVTFLSLAAGFDLGSATNLTELRISRASKNVLLNSVFPPFLDLVSVTVTPLVQPDNITIPASVKDLDMTGSRITVLPKLPPNLKTLTLATNQFSSIDFDYPTTLEKLSFNSNSKLVNLGPATLPPSLKNFSCISCPLKSIRGIAWPSTLAAVTLQTSDSTELEVRESDVDIFEVLQAKPFTTSMTTTTCSDDTAKLQIVRNATLCVITDERYESLYGKPFASETPGSMSSSRSFEDVGPESSSRLNVSTPLPSAGETSNSTDVERGSSTSPREPADENSNIQSNGADRSPTKDRSNPGTRSDQSRPSSAVSSIVIVLSSIATVTLAVIGYLVFMISRHTGIDEGISKGYHGIVSPSSKSESSTRNQSEDDDHENSVWHDPTMLRLRIEMKPSQIGAVMSVSTPYEMLYGEYKMQAVTLKRLTSEALLADEDGKLLPRFIEDICMSSTLDHPKIVAFIGVTWSCRQDIALVSEYMGGGDLCALLEKQPTPSSPQDWFQPWTATKTVKSKALLALDVVDAVVYLHSFSSPILHRDLKARNVLLDAEGNAKLSDFGISRELSLDATMTSEVGTVAWIAPEVLRGDRYSEKADIYSLGVLLVELDRCRHPYADGVELAGVSGSLQGSGTSVGLAYRNTHIAVLVGSGLLRPMAEADSPIRELVARCVSWESYDRPGASEVKECLHRLHAVPGQE